MKQQVVYNLEEFATKYHLNDIFGAYAAHFSIGAAYSRIIEIDATAPYQYRLLCHGARAHSLHQAPLGKTGSMPTPAPYNRG